MINLHESMGPDRDRTRDPWICNQIRICSQTRYRLRYAARRSTKGSDSVSLTGVLSQILDWGLVWRNWESTGVMRCSIWNWESLIVMSFQNKMIVWTLFTRTWIADHLNPTPIYLSSFENSVDHHNANVDYRLGTFKNYDDKECNF